MKVVTWRQIFEEAGESAQIREWEEEVKKRLTPQIEKRLRAQMEERTAAEREQHRQETERLRRENERLRAALGA